MACKGECTRNPAHFARGLRDAREERNEDERRARRLARRAILNTTQVRLKAGLGFFIFTRRGSLGTLLNEKEVER